MLRISFIFPKKLRILLNEIKLRKDIESEVILAKICENKLRTEILRTILQYSYIKLYKFVRSVYKHASYFISKYSVID